MFVPPSDVSAFAFGGPESFGLAFVLSSGRVLLAWLPPSRIGGHKPTRVATTLVASSVLGFLVAWILSPLPQIIAWTLVLAALAARVYSLPAAMVPRHEPSAPAASNLSRTLCGLTSLVLVLFAAQALGWIDFPGWSGGPTVDRLIQLRSVFATAGVLALFNYGGKVARRSAWLTSALGLLFLVSPSTAESILDEPSAIENALLVAAGSAFTLAWLRRGDKRARVLAMAAYTGLATFSEHGFGLALAGWAGLVAFTPKQSFAGTLKLYLAGLIFALSVGRHSFTSFPSRPASGVFDTLLALSAPIAYPLFVVLALVGLGLYATKRTPKRVSIDTPRREGGAAFFTLGSALLVSPWTPEALPSLAILAAFAVLLSAIPPERSKAQA